MKRFTTSGLVTLIGVTGTLAANLYLREQKIQPLTAAAFYFLAFVVFAGGLLWGLSQLIKQVETAENAAAEAQKQAKELKEYIELHKADIQHAAALREGFEMKMQQVREEVFRGLKNNPHQDTPQGT